MPSYCTIDDCNLVVQGRGMCRRHYGRWFKGRPVEGPFRPWGTGEWGEWYVEPKGYVTRERRVSGKREFQKQHRVVMEEKIGRPLIENENVHHINGDKTDNHPDNLELWSKSQPPGQRVEDKADWAIEILKLYRPEALK